MKHFIFSDLIDSEKELFISCFNSLYRKSVAKGDYDFVDKVNDLFYKFTGSILVYA